MTGSPGFSRWDTCRERLIRLKPGLLKGESQMKFSILILPILAARSRRDAPQRVSPGLLYQMVYVYDKAS
jgi:hypothetical protein